MIGNGTGLIWFGDSSLLSIAPGEKASSRSPKTGGSSLIGFGSNSFFDAKCLHTWCSTGTGIEAQRGRVSGKRRRCAEGGKEHSFFITEAQTSSRKLTYSSTYYIAPYAYGPPYGLPPPAPKGVVVLKPNTSGVCVPEGLAASAWREGWVSNGTFNIF